MSSLVKVHITSPSSDRIMLEMNAGCYATLEVWLQNIFCHSFSPLKGINEKMAHTMQTTELQPFHQPQSDFGYALGGWLVHLTKKTRLTDTYNIFRKIIGSTVSDQKQTETKLQLQLFSPIKTGPRKISDFWVMMFVSMGGFYAHGLN